MRKLEDMISGMDVAELGDLGRQLMALGSPPGLGAAAHPPRPNRRRPRRQGEVTYRVRVDLKGTKPPVWRRLELSSMMFLDELHRVIQGAFGWTDSHLHRFAVGPSVWDRSAELYLCPFDVEEGDEEGVAEHEVRLDEVLVDVGDKLLYVYDYGDDWEHVVRLEAVMDRRDDHGRAVCTGGRRAGPPEDCGGVWGYQELAAAGRVDAEHFDVEEVNSALALDEELAGTAAGVPGLVAYLMPLLMGGPFGHQVAELLRDARLDEPVDISAEEAARMVRHYVWLLDRVGEDGIRLTAAGYLPPGHVEATLTELELKDEWIGKGNREVRSLPVLELRESAQKLGLLRKSRGQLLLTRAATRLRDDPVALWWHVVARLPLYGDESIERHAGVVTLVGVAAGRDIRAESFRLLLVDVLGAVGWRSVNWEPLDSWAGARAARDTVHLLDHLGAFAQTGWLSKRAEPTPGGSALARAVLQR